MVHGTLGVVTWLAAMWIPFFLTTLYFLLDATMSQNAKIILPNYLREGGNRYSKIPQLRGIWGHTLEDFFIYFGERGSKLDIQAQPPMLLGCMCLWQIQYLQSARAETSARAVWRMYTAIFEGSIHCSQMLQVHTSPHQYTHTHL